MTLQDLIQDARDRYVIRPTGRETVRPMPEGFVRPPRYRYPSQRAYLPQNCGHCGVRLMICELPTAEHPLVDLSCYLCSQIACELLYDGVPVSTTANPLVLDPTLCLECEERPRADGRRFCGTCAARRRRDQAAVRIAGGTAWCLDCGVVPRSVKHARCAKCRHAKYRNGVGS